MTGTAQKQRATHVIPASPSPHIHTPCARIRDETSVRAGEQQHVSARCKCISQLPARPSREAHSRLIRPPSQSTMHDARSISTTLAQAASIASITYTYAYYARCAPHSPRVPPSASISSGPQASFIVRPRHASFHVQCRLPTAYTPGQLISRSTITTRPFSRLPAAPRDGRPYACVGSLTVVDLSSVRGLGPVATRACCILEAASGR